jgi:putative ABC transport system permease protein
MIVNALVLAFREIRRNVLRSSLTTLGVVIGVAAVIVMVTLGNGATAMVTASIASLGSNVLTLVPGQMRGPGGAGGTVKPFRQSDVDAVARNLQLVAVSPVSSTSLAAVVGNKNHATTVTGTTNAYFTVGNWTLAAGRFFLDSEIRAGGAVCVIGATASTELFGAQEPLGAQVRLRSMSCEVIGVLKSKGRAAMGPDRDDVVVMPLRTYQRRIGGTEDISTIQMSVRDGISSTQVQADIQRLMRERRRLGTKDENDFSIMDMKDLAKALTGTTQTLTMLLAAVAAISLLVGGIGIMNIMLVSVTERTREIGIRLAIGALEHEVLTQFLVEAVVLSAFGGLAGITLALAASAVIATLLGMPFTLDLSIVALAFVFSALVGVVFGFFPARRAAQLNPIDALRHE